LNGVIFYKGRLVMFKQQAVSKSVLQLIIVLVLIKATMPGSALAEGPTSVSSNISSDTTWIVANSPYTLTKGIIIESNATLIIEPGVTVYGRDGTYIEVEGTLQAVGTAENKIIFSSEASQINPQGNQWAGLFFNGGAGQLNHTIISYGGDIFPTTTYRATIYIKTVKAGNEVRIENSQIQHGGTSADNLHGSVAINVGALHQVRLIDNNFSDNFPNRIWVSRGTIVTNTTLFFNEGLEGYELEMGGGSNNTLSVAEGATLTIEPGVTMMFPTATYGGGTALDVRGELKAVGTTTQPITFTSVADTAGNQWAGIHFNGGFGELRHVIVRYAGDTVGKQFTFIDSYESNKRANFVVESIKPNKELVIANSQIHNAGTAESKAWGVMTVYLNALPQLRLIDNNFHDNFPNRIWLPRGTLVNSATLSAQDGLEGYELQMGSGSDNTLSVAEGATLEVEPGVMMMFPTATYGGGTALEVRGQLKAIGTANQPITFTSLVNTGKNQWAGIHFNGGSGELRHATVRYAGDTVGKQFFFVSGYQSGKRANIVVQDTTVEKIAIEHSQIYSSSGSGLYLSGNQVDITCTNIRNNTEHGIYIENGAVNMFSSHVSGNGKSGLTNISQITQTVSHNWWGDATGPGGIGPGLGDAITGRAVFEPWLSKSGCVVDLAISASEPETINLGQSVTYTYYITNYGPGEASNVSITEIATGVTFISASYQTGTGTSAVDCSQADNITCNLGNLTMGDNGELAIVVIPEQSYTNYVTVSATETDYIPTNNSIGLVTEVLSAELILATTIPVTPINIGEAVTYTHHVINNGPGTAINVTLTEIMTEGVEIQSVTTEPDSTTCDVSNITISCNLGTMAKGDVVTITVSTIPTRTYTSQVVVNSVTDNIKINNSSSPVIQVILPVINYLPVIFR
jgi:uncharacterized repeat protein (TIGR01451 family)